MAWQRPAPETLNTLGSRYKKEGKNQTIKIILIVAISFTCIAVAYSVLSINHDPVSGSNLQKKAITPIPTIAPATIVEPTITPTPEPVITPVPEGAYPDAHGDYLYDIENNTYYPVNRTPTPEPISPTVEEARRLGWTPDCGDVETWIYNYNLARGYIKLKPDLTLSLLSEDGKTPWDWYREVIEPGKYISGYVVIKNNRDTAYQGDIDIYVNASLFYNGGLVHMENKIDTQMVSLTPYGENRFYKKWEVPKDLTTGMYEVIIELREKEYGTTIYSYRLTPAVAHVSDHGEKYF